MPKYVHIVAHLTSDDLEQRYRKADDPAEQSHLQIVWLLALGKVRMKSPSVNIEVFSLALAHFVQAVKAGPDRHVVLVLDWAGWYKSEGIHLLFLPPYSPELQPCEHLWPLINEVIANRRFESLDELQVVQAERCVVLQDDPLRLRRHTLFHWWPLSDNEKPT